MTWNQLYERSDPFISVELNEILGVIHLDTDTNHAVWDGHSWYSDREWQTDHEHQWLDAHRYLFELENTGPMVFG